MWPGWWGGGEEESHGPSLFSHVTVFFHTKTQECASLAAAAAAADAAAGVDDGDNGAACVLRRGCILDTLPSGSRGALAATRGDGVAAAAARSSPPLTPAGATLALRSRVVHAASMLLGEGEDGISLVGEQFIVKPPKSAPASSFPLHVDADALPGGRHSPDARAYVSVWVPLDACDAGSGGLVVAGVPLTLPAGTGVAMRGDALHESPGNGSGRWRRAWMPQYCRGEGLGAGWRVRVL